MFNHIVSVAPDRLDEHCALITLRHVPSTLERLLGHKHSIITYKGQTDNWYVLPSYQPASTDIAVFLNDLLNKCEFRHLRLQLEQARNSRAFPLLRRRTR